MLIEDNIWCLGIVVIGCWFQYPRDLVTEDRAESDSTSLSLQVTLINNNNKQCTTHVLKLDLTTLFWQRACLVHESALAVSAPTYTTFGKKSCIVYHPCTTNMHSYKDYFYLYMLFDIRIKA